MLERIDVLPSRVCSGGGGEASDYQPLNDCFIATLHWHFGGGERSDYQPLTWPFIEALPSGVRINGIEDRGGYQGFRPERIELLPSRLWSDGVDGWSRYQAFRLERIGTSLHGFAVHGRDDRAHA